MREEGERKRKKKTIEKTGKIEMKKRRKSTDGRKKTNEEEEEDRGEDGF